ncbi:MAG TPA: hypothetical protein VJP40_05540 [bacterium]|nr:hypothetical protein [bacterium]
MGLSIAKSLVDLHQGEIGGAALPGQGSEFWIQLPLQDIPSQVSGEGA